jgi:3-oxoacyl-[acyl-carrier protein] reductase
MQSLKNKNALVTGAAGGIGRAIALRLAEEGVNLFLLDIDPLGLSDVVSAAKQRGVLATGRLCDVSQLSDIKAAVDHGLNSKGRFDMLVNNAGITYYGRTEVMSAEHCEQLLTVNLHAPIHFTRLLLPTLLERPEAHVLNVASFMGLVGVRKLATYSASKFGLVGFSEALRAEYARTNLGVTALCPGFVESKLFESAPLGNDRRFPKRPPQWMLSSCEKVATRAIKAILRDEALVVMQSYAKLTHFAKRFFPGLLDFAHHLSRKRFTPQSETPPSEEDRRAAA